MLWLGVGYTPGASSSKQLGSQHWGKRIIRIVPLTWIQQQGAAFETVPSDLFRSTLCRWCYTWLMYMIWCIFACCALLICYHELFRYLDYYLIMIIVWEAWPRLLIMLYYWLCYAVDILSLVMTDWSGLSRRICPFNSVSYTYMITGEFHMCWFRICFVRLCVIDVLC